MRLGGNERLPQVANHIPGGCERGPLPKLGPLRVAQVDLLHPRGTRQPSKNPLRLMTTTKPGTIRDHGRKGNRASTYPVNPMPNRHATNVVEKSFAWHFSAEPLPGGGGAPFVA